MSGALDPTALGTADFSLAASDLPPPGDCWPRDLATLLQGVVSGMSDLTAGVHAQAIDILVNETDPALCEQLLPDFERVYGLPDPCTPLNPTVAQRRTALLLRMSAQGGCSPAYFTAVAAAIDVSIVVTRVIPSWAGQQAVGAPLYGAQAAGEWIVRVLSGDVVSIGQMRCVLARLQPGQAAIYWQ